MRTRSGGITPILIPGNYIEITCNDLTATGQALEQLEPLGHIFTSDLRTCGEFGFVNLHDPNVLT